MKDQAPPPPRIVCLSNVVDQQYETLRGEKIAPTLSSPKRRDLFRCLELATGREVIVLSSPPKSLERRAPRWLPALETRFSTHRQFFCANWDAPKVRIPLGWLFYACQAVRRIRSGDVVIIDNYEFIYLVAAYAVRLFRRVDFVLEYEDGKHAIDKSWHAILSGLAEKMGRRIIRAAILAHPALGRRLPPGVPTVLVPGFVVRATSPLEPPPGVPALAGPECSRTPGNPSPGETPPSPRTGAPTSSSAYSGRMSKAGEDAGAPSGPEGSRLVPLNRSAEHCSATGATTAPSRAMLGAPTTGSWVGQGEGPVQGTLQLLYSGSLDRTRGVDLLLAALPFLPESGWHLHITGSGGLGEAVAAVAAEPRWQGRVTFHGALTAADYAALTRRCQVGLNCQRLSDPISAVTFPSKVFSYLSARLLVLSSRASEVPTVCGEGCVYYEEETPSALAEAIQRVVQHYEALSRSGEAGKLAATYGIEGTAQRLQILLRQETM